MSSFLISKDFECNFCTKQRKGDKFNCDLCNFQICVGCAAPLIKYHRGRKHIQHFQHEHHPLVLLEIMEVETRDTKECQMCSKEIQGKSYCCAPCGFYIHKSCGELLQNVQHPFHPQHYLILRITEIWISDACRACGLQIDDYICYKCEACEFMIHNECLSLKPNIKYHGHPHDLLTLLEGTFFNGSQCDACGFEIEGTLSVRCAACRLDFHVQCGPAAASRSLPPIVVHKSHNHPLSLVTESKAVVKDDSFLVYCDDCKEEIDPNHPSYGCSECDQYRAHVRCLITEIQLDERERHEHFTHHHFLVLLESERSDDIECYLCKKWIIQGHTAYGCDPCKHYLHKSCFELPKVMRHESHDSHYLTLHDLRYLTLEDEKRVCKACGNHLNGHIYRCGSCDFNLDLECASQHPSIKWKASSDDECKYHDEDREEGIGHYSHYHHLKPSAVGDVEFELCHKNIHGSSYGCEPCMFYIHKSCAELPQRFQHPFHPHSFFTLEEYTDEERFRCEACYFYVNPGVGYQCDSCKTYLHLECVSLKPNIKYEDHQHLLILVENMSYQSKCQACHCEIDGTFFVRCVECDLNFHVQCGTVSYPSTVRHQHHHHPLMLTTDETLVKDDSILHSCGVCKEKGDPTPPSYCCVECEYYTHMRCVINEMQFNKREKVKHFSHEDHFLFLVGNKNGDIKCCACDKPIETDPPAYGCEQCRYYLHKSCIELPRQIQHLFHRHPLTLKSYPDNGTKYQHCSACDKKLGGFFYQCDKYCFVLDVNCALLGIQFKGVGYILTLFEKFQHTPECQKYAYATIGALDENCVKCNSIVCLLRSPLVQTIECSSHHHPLTLTKKVADDNYGTQICDVCEDTQICDVCEEDRDPEVCVYYCAECDFIAEFVCVISEVMLALQKQRRDVPLRSINRKTTSKRLTYGNLRSSFTVEERHKWEEIKEAFRRERWEIYENSSEAGHEAKEITSEQFVYSDEDRDFLRSLVVWLHADEMSLPRGKVSLIEEEEYNVEVIDVGNYKTIPRLAGVLKNLIDRYGDIGATCKLPQSCSNLKMCIMIHFCATVHSMCNALIRDVSDGLLYTWWKHFSRARQVGFDVKFLFDHLRKINQARRRKSDTQYLKNTSIQSIYDKMAEISREIDKQKTKLAVLRRQAQQGISNIPYQRLRSDVVRLSEDMEFGLMKAGVHTDLL